MIHFAMKKQRQKGDRKLPWKWPIKRGGCGGPKMCLFSKKKEPKRVIRYRTSAPVFDLSNERTRYISPLQSCKDLLLPQAETFKTFLYFDTVSRLRLKPI